MDSVRLTKIVESRGHQRTSVFRSNSRRDPQEDFSCLIMKTPELLDIVFLDLESMEWTVNQKEQISVTDLDTAYCEHETEEDVENVQDTVNQLDSVLIQLREEVSQSTTTCQVGSVDRRVRQKLAEI